VLTISTRLEYLQHLQTAVMKLSRKKKGVNNKNGNCFQDLLVIRAIFSIFFTKCQIFVDSSCSVMNFDAFFASCDRKLKCSELYYYQKKTGSLKTPLCAVGNESLLVTMHQ